MGRLDFAILGPLEVRCGGDPLPLRGARERAVLAALLIEADSVVPLDRLIGAVWDDDPPAGAEKAVRNCVSSLRRRVAGAGGPATLIETGPAGYRLRLDGCDLDLRDFDGRVAGARAMAAAGQATGAVTAFRDALARWRGPALAGVRGTLIGAAAARLDEQRMAALEECLDLELALGRHREVAAELRGYTAEWPLRERLAGQLMLALYRSDRQAEALDAFHRLAKRLADDLGLDPSGPVKRLHEAILRQDPAIDVPANPGGDASGVAGRDGSGTAHATTGQPVPAQLPLDVPGFTGRTAELRQLHGLLPDRSGPVGAETVVISAIGGSAGVGKTALAVRFAHQVADRFPDGQLYANLRGFDPSAAPVRPAEVLSGFLVALGAAPDTIPGGLDAQAALYRSLLDRKRMLVLLDNARDADQVRPLLPGSPGCLVLVTSRDQLSGLAASAGARPLILDVLTEDEALALLARRLGAGRPAAEPSAARELVALCARLPLALSIAAARAAVRPRLTLADLAAELRDTHRRLDALDAGDPAANVRAVFSWSYRQLDPPAARLFRLLGLHPGPDITTAAAASLAAAAEPEARRLLAGLTRAHLVIEHARGRFTFHDLLRAYAAEQAREHDSDTDRHAALHRLLDHHLHTAYAASRPVNPARRGISLAAPQPGVEPERFSDSHDALGWLDAEHQVLAAITSHAADSGFDAYAWQLPCMLSRFRARRGYRQQRVESLQVALAAAGRVGDLEAQARVHYELGSACNGIGRHDDGAMHAQRARELYERLGDREGEAAAIGMIGRTFELQGRASEAVEYSQRQLDLYQALGEPVRIAQALNQHGWYCALLGDTRRALDCCEQALVIFRQVGDLAGVAATCDSLGFAHHLAGDLDKAASCYGDAILAFEEVGDLPERARTLVRLGDVHVAAGDRDAARDAWQEALNVFEDLQVPDAAEVRARLGLPDPDGT